MILYFSGTGNSRYAAQVIGDALGDSLVSIGGRLKEGETDPLYSRRPFVVVSPVYAWRLPRVVERFMRETAFGGDTRFYFVLTCGGDVGAAAKYAAKLCCQKGFRFCGLAGVRMPENFITMFRAPGKDEAREIILHAKDPLAQAADFIREGKHLPVYKPALPDLIKSGVVNDLFYPLFMSAKGYGTTSACTGCGSCVRLCPLNNIRLEGGRPVWGGNCTQCMACICGCPETAVEYKNKTKGKERYYLRSADVYTDPDPEK